MSEFTSFPIPRRNAATDSAAKTALRNALHTEADVGDQSGTYEWDFAVAQQIIITLTGDLTLTATNMDAPTAARLIVIQDSVGGHTLTLGSGFATQDGNQPDISLVPGRTTSFNGFVSGGSVILDLQNLVIPVTGSVYTEDWSAYTVGQTNLLGFSQPWSSAVTEIVEVGGERRLRARAAIDNTRAALLHTAASIDANRVKASVFIEAIANLDSTSTIGNIRCLGRVGGASGTETGVAGGIGVGSVARIDEYDNGAFQTLETTSFNHSEQRIRLLLTLDGSTATLKSWLASDAEPANPQITETTAVTQEGGLGMLLFNDRDVDIAFLSIATGDAEPNRPA